MGESVPPVTVRNQQGKTEEIVLEKMAPGLFRTTKDVERPGLYKMTQGDLSAIAHAGVEDVREMSEVTATETTAKGKIELTEAQVIVSGGRVRRSILSPRVRVNSYSEVEDSVLFENVDAQVLGLIDDHQADAVEFNGLFLQAVI